jgi:hypothetical protein
METISSLLSWEFRRRPVSPPLPIGRRGTPTLAGGIGWHDFDVQGTIAYTHPTDEKNHIGNSLVTSATLQYHFLVYFWPEFALNDTQWMSGERAYKNQLLVGPGIMFGRFQIYNRVKFNFGIAYQAAVVPDHHIADPLTPFGMIL